MPPLRRYIRLTAHSALEVRIFLENPLDESRWLLNQTTPALPRIFEAVRPLILPKLREERERTALTKNKGKKGRSVKDVVEGDGFRVVVFLTEGVGGRHEVVVRRRTARERGRGSVVVTEEEEEVGDVVLADVPGVNEVEVVGERERDGDEVFAYKDDKKKLGFDTRYEGFSIWGKVLCLLVERKGGIGKKDVGDVAAQKVMQEWISSTQVGADDDEDG